MNKILDTVLLLALPASGKSEVRRYMAKLSPDQCRNDFHMGPTVQLDDFPYVHFMRCADEALQQLGQERIFFRAPDRPFRDPRDWGTLIQLINEDYADLLAQKTRKTRTPGQYMLDRVEAASERAGIAPRLSRLDAKTRETIARELDDEAAGMLDEKNTLALIPLEGKTIVIEFARGGAQGSSMPLEAPFGYGYSLSQLSDDILSRAKILYVWVTPEESRRKNQERTNPDDPGSILHHGVPIEVMLNDYGCDDMEWLENASGQPGVVQVAAHGTTYTLPIARFDNRVDKTSFIRNEPKDWRPEQVQAVHEGLKGALARLAGFTAT